MNGSAIVWAFVPLTILGGGVAIGIAGAFKLGTWFWYAWPVAVLAAAWTYQLVAS